jgi:manganese/iron transport system substrate-binding protein
MVKSLAVRTRRWIGVAALTFTVGVVGCTPPEVSESPQGEADSATATEPPVDRPQVVATSSVLCDLTQQIAEETIALTCLLEPNQDPHVYEATPSDRRAIEDADLVLYGGYAYESTLIRAIDATNTPAPKVAVFEEAVAAPLVGEPHDHDHGHDDDHEHSHDHDDEHNHDHDHEHDDEHSHAEDSADGAAVAVSGDEQEHSHADASSEVPDPHIWHNAENGVRIAEVIRDNLEQIAPEHAELYQENTEAIAAELNQIDEWIRTQVVTVPEPQRRLVTPHDSMQYFAEAYGFTIVGALEGLSTEQRPSAARMSELVDIVQEAEVPAIFAEATTNRNLIEAIANDANVEVAEQPLFVEGPGGEGTPAPTYQAMLIENTCNIVDSLGGQCDASTVTVAGN